MNVVNQVTPSPEQAMAFFCGRLAGQLNIKTRGTLPGVAGA